MNPKTKNAPFPRKNASWKKELVKSFKVQSYDNNKNKVWIVRNVARAKLKKSVVERQQKSEFIISSVLFDKSSIYFSINDFTILSPLSPFGDCDGDCAEANVPTEFFSRNCVPITNFRSPIKCDRFRRKNTFLRNTSLEIKRKNLKRFYGQHFYYLSLRHSAVSLGELGERLAISK